MTNVSKRTAGSRRMNAFPAIALLMTFVMAIVVFMEIL